MASSLLKLAAILSLVFSILLALNTQITLSSDIEDDEEEYVLDTPLEDFRSRSRFLASVIKKGTTVEYVATSANLESLAAMEDVQISFPTLIIVESAPRSVLRGLDASMEHVVEYTKSSVCATNKESLYGGDSLLFEIVYPYRSPPPNPFWQEMFPLNASAKASKFP
ncbi:hypothetical protein NC653_004105 [Populus alba x Populus x berolinensis]|uniref:Uncharacterized protein n=1 Tax=Populus alba x Populus x berolinensis TaxID=444605 RepID=A0AAD6RU82_9ROSI|nr:hypothetical protein NC653_004105 [Populus alba x Populus x berolinensis]